MRVFYLIHVKEKVIHHRYCTSLMGRKKVLYDVPYFPRFFKGEILCFTFQLLELQLCRYHQLPSFQPTFLVPFINQVAIITEKQLMTLCRIKQQKILLSKVSLIERQKLQAEGSKELNFPLINFLFPRCTILKWRREHVQQCMREF